MSDRVPDYLPPAITFDELYRRDFAAVVAVAYVLSGSRTAAEELAQKAFLAAHRRWQDISGYDDPGAWVRRVCVNRSISLVRRRVSEAKAMARLASRRVLPEELPPDSEAVLARSAPAAAPPGSGGRSALPRRSPHLRGGDRAAVRGGDGQGPSVASPSGTCSRVRVRTSFRREEGRAMNRDDLDTRILEAARDARQSVARLEIGNMAHRPAGAHILRRHRRIPAAAVVAVAAVVVVMATTLSILTDGESDTTTNVAAGRPTESQAPPPPPDEPPDPPSPSGPIIAEGRLRSGHAWLLHVGGPGDGLCLAVEIAGEGRPTTCSSHPVDAVRPEGEVYRPLVHGDVRVPPVVFGRMPAGITEVEVALADGGTTERSGVYPGPGGPFYMVEVPGDAPPVTVVGFGEDGTSALFDVRR